jgi:hypothetical protein
MLWYCDSAEESEMPINSGLAEKSVLPGECAGIDPEVCFAPATPTDRFQ